MKVKYLGHAALLIESGNVKALIDPFLTGNPQYRKNDNDINGITHILVTHAHGDHIGDTLSLAKANNSLIIANAELSSIIRSKDSNLNIHAMHIGGRKEFDFGKIKMTPALHGSGYHDNGTIIDGGNPGGFIIEINGKKLYHSGDTGLMMDMQLLDAENIDIAFLPIGGNYTMDVDDAVRAVDFINAKITVPIHYNTWPIISADPLDFKQKCESHSIVIMEPGRSIEI